MYARQNHLQDRQGLLFAEPCAGISEKVRGTETPLSIHPQPWSQFHNPTA